MLNVEQLRSAVDEIKGDPAEGRPAPPETNEIIPGILEEFPILNYTFAGVPIRSIVIFAVARFLLKKLIS